MTRVQIEFMNNETNEICQTWYKVNSTTNEEAVVNAITLFSEQVTKNNKNFSLINASIDNDIKKKNVYEEMIDVVAHYTSCVMCPTCGALTQKNFVSYRGLMDYLSRKVQEG